ncbi:TIGR02117 family protein [Aminobacter sp. MDW-2]|uniref:TIGR02117 family protein n=1 Tax=Aminobacter sp. MDW-2 TaxID=2666139 RepID=UPI0012B13724|nr:TIGR02117 family protein [Aminobacter sp. MDW-2]MRX34124.1 TIGR02117 family protein [Aminobacter sp. MDW-2]QNH33169.1 TIGR02117 family protein [Aminobacter sp. MDW-2]
MKRILRLLGAVVFVAVAAVALGTLVPRPLFGRADDQAAPRHILVFTNPIHTDIAVPIDDAVLQKFGFLLDAGIQADLPAARYLVFGWGSKAFYIGTPTWSELKPGPVFAALTLDNSVMHVDLAGDVDLPQPAVQRFELGEAGFAAMLDFIERSFVRDEGAVQRIFGVAYGEYDGFFDAHGKFNALAGCNTWTAAALREAGLTTGWWNPLPATLNFSLGLYNRSSDDPGGDQPGGVQP